MVVNRNYYTALLLRDPYCKDTSANVPFILQHRRKAGVVLKSRCSAIPGVISTCERAGHASRAGRRELFGACSFKKSNATMSMNATVASRASGGGGGNPAQSRRRVQRAFKMRGLAVQAGALDAMLNVLSREASQSSQEVLTAVLDEIKERLMQSDRGGGKGGGGGGRGSGSGGGGGGGQQLVVTKSLLADVVADLSRDGGDVTEEALQLLDAFSTPRLSYDSMRKQFTLLTDRMEKRSLHGEAIHKVRA